MKIRCAALYSGSLGNRTWGINRGQAYVRRRSVPVNRTTPRQGRVRSALALWSSKWTTDLSQEQRDAWRTYAQSHFTRDVFGIKRTLPPICWLIMYNSRLTDAGLPRHALPPPWEGTFPLIWTAVDFFTDFAVIVKFAHPQMANLCIQLFQSLPVSPGKRPSFQHARLVGYSPLGQTSPWTVNIPYPVHLPKTATFSVAIMDRWGQISNRSHHPGARH